MSTNIGARDARGAGCGNNDARRWRNSASNAGPRRAANATRSDIDAKSRARMPPSATRAPTGLPATTMGNTRNVRGRRRPSQPKNAALPGVMAGLPSDGDGSCNAPSSTQSFVTRNCLLENCTPSAGPERNQPAQRASRKPIIAAKGMNLRAYDVATRAMPSRESVAARCASASTRSHRAAPGSPRSPDRSALAASMAAPSSEKSGLAGTSRSVSSAANRSSGAVPYACCKPCHKRTSGTTWGTNGFARMPLTSSMSSRSSGDVHMT